MAVQTGESHITGLRYYQSASTVTMRALDSLYSLVSLGLTGLRTSTEEFLTDPRKVE